MRRKPVLGAFALTILVIGLAMPVFAVAVRSKPFGAFHVRVRSASTYLNERQTSRDGAWLTLAPTRVTGESLARDGSAERFIFDFVTPVAPDPRGQELRFQGRIDHI